MRTAPLQHWVRWIAAAVAVSLGGCTALSGSDEEGLNLPDPGPAFMKKVERDPFPRAGAPAAAS
jgi:hypothetical protein